MITSTSTKDFTKPAVPLQAVTIETTHLLFNFKEGAGYLRQVWKDSDGNTLSRRFLKVEGTKYDTIETSILTKVQKVADDIELDVNNIDGVEITEIDRSDFFVGTQ